MASLRAAMSACRIASTTLLATDAVILPLDLAVLPLVTSKTGILARMAALTVVPARDIAPMIGSGHVIKTLDHDIVIAPWNFPFDGDLAANRGGVLSLPARCRRKPVATWEYEIDIVYLNRTLERTCVTTSSRTGMIAPFLRPRTRFLAKDYIVQNIRMTPSSARMATMKSLVAR